MYKKGLLMQLQEKLDAAERELETMKLTAQTSEAAIKTEHSQKVAGWFFVLILFKGS